MKAVKKWLNNSKFIASLASDNFKAKFDYEIKLRKEAVINFKKEKIKITPSQVIGTYRIIGQNPDDQDSSYIGNLEIFFKGKELKATWNISGYTHSGYGMLVSSRILVFNYSYKDGDGNIRTGLVTYTFLSQNIVKGEWLEEDFPSRGIEELRKLSDDEDNSIDTHDANLGFSLN